MRKDPYHTTFLESFLNQGCPKKSKDFNMDNYAYYLLKNLACNEKSK